MDCKCKLRIERRCSSGIGERDGLRTEVSR